MRTAVIRATVLVIIISCFKQESAIPAPVPEKGFPVKFIFISKDKNIKYLHLTSYYYNKLTDSTHKFYRLYDRTGIVSQHPITDTIKHKESRGIVGSRKAFEVQLQLETGGPHLREVVFRSDITLGGDTLKKAEDGIEIFRWPEDSAKYTRTCCN